MARARTLQSDFTGGELDPKLYGRVGIPRYQSGLKTAKNVDIMITGGATRRNGSRFIYNAGAGVTVRKIPLRIFRSDLTPPAIKGYVIEFRSDNKIRFYVDKALILSAGVPYEITSPFTGADLSLLKFDQYNNELYLVHPNFFPQKLTRTTDTSWAIAPLSLTLNTPAAVTRITSNPDFTEQANPKNFAINGLAWFPSLALMVAVGAADGTDAYIATSQDGVTWTERANPKNVSLNAVCWDYVNSQFVAVGNGDGTDSYILTSPDGITWTEQAPTVAKNIALNGITVLGIATPLLVAVGAADGADAYILTSPDGVTWTERANAKNITLKAVAYGAGLVVAVGAADGADGYILTSTDGVTWTERANPKNFGLNGVAFKPTVGPWVAVGAADGTNAYTLTSLNGTTWNTETTNDSNIALNAVCWIGNQFMAVGAVTGSNSYVITSELGDSWNYGTRANPKNFALNAVLWTGSQVVAAGAADGTDAYIINWTSGSTCTVTCGAAHGMVTGDVAQIIGSSTSYFNGYFDATVTGATTFTYRLTEFALSPAPGTITYAHVPWGTATTGYPAAVAFNEQRLLFANTKRDPFTIWGSEAGSLLNFVLGVLDTSPFEFRPSKATTPIDSLTATTQVAVLTNDKELIMGGGGGEDTVVTPTSVLFTQASTYGAKNGIRACVVGAELLFAARSGKRVRAMSFEFVKSAYIAPNISIASEHLLTSGIVEMWHVVEPQSTVYIVTASGVLVRIAYDREQECIAFSRYETDGLVKGLCVLSEGDTDQVWISVQRTISGVANTYVEVLEDGLNTDAAYTGTDGAGKTTWTGLSHLEGKTVDVVADNVALTGTVASGQLVLAAAAKAVEIGLHYESEIHDLRPELSPGDGTGQGRQSVSTDSIVVRLKDSRGYTINGELQADDGTSFSGDKEVTKLGWGDGEAQVIIKQTKPLPLTVLAIIKRVTVND